MSEITKGKIVFLCLLFIATLLLSGCRVRVAADRPEGDFSSADMTSGPVYGTEGEGEEAQSGEGSPADSPEGSEEDRMDASERTIENPDAARKEFDEQADAEIVQGTERTLHTQGEGGGTALTDPEAEEAARLLNDEAEKTAVQTLPAQEAEKMGAAEDGETADSAQTYYTVLLKDRLSSLFECQRLYVYWETEEDFVTVYKTSPEHQLILDGGCYDVSARLTEERLRVDEGWVCRKNPDVIVKIVSPAVLGGGVYSPEAARRVRAALIERADWRGMNAVREGRVVMLSSEMLEAPHLRLMAELILAKTAYPALFSDVELGEALGMLTEEATGMISEAVYYDTGA